jgi:preprotein translocase subunit Sec63
MGTIILDGGSLTTTSSTTGAQNTTRINQPLLSVVIMISIHIIIMIPNNDKLFFIRWIDMHDV